MALSSAAMPGDDAAAPPDAGPLPPASAHGAVLAFDFGLRRIGVAVGDLSLRIAHPLETIDSREEAVRFARIAALVGEWRPVRVVVGLPETGDGGEHALAPAVRAFRAELERRFMIPTECVNERYTSANAEGMLRDAGVRGRAQKQYLDQVAATTILDDYFANHDDTDA
jgi:putative holliday junction resolvase